MSFIFRDRDDDDYLIGTPWMRNRVPQCDRNVYDCLKEFREEEEERKRLERESRNLENFYAGGL